MKDIIILDKENLDFFETKEVHAKNCKKVQKKLDKGFHVAGNDWLEYVEIFSDLASDYLSNDDPEEVWKKACINEAHHNVQVKKCALEIIEELEKPYKNIEIDI